MAPKVGVRVVFSIGTGLALALACACSADAHHAPFPADDRALYAAAFAAADEGQWETAYSLAAKGHYPRTAKVLTWLQLIEAQPIPRFEAFAGFLAANPDWPLTGTLRRRAEAAIDHTVDNDRVRAWFADHPPLSGVGKARLAEAHLDAGDEATALLRDAWINGDFLRREERAFLKRHRKRLTADDHNARLDRLLWDGKSGAAHRQAHRVDAGHRALAEARRRLKLRAGGVDAAIARVPDDLLADPGLQYERLRWRRRKGFDERAREILAVPPDELVRPAAWWREAHIQSRKAVREGLISVAYRLASDHRQTAPLPRAQAEWLAGWIALRFFDDPDLAYPHFTLLHAGVRYPISVARAAYWAGRAAGAANEPGRARHWYERAVAFPTTFYGQLALAALDAQGPLPLPPDPEASAADRAFIEANELTGVVRTLARIGLSDRVRPFVLRLGELAETPGQRRLVAAEAKAAGRTDLGVLVARRSARVGTLLIEHSYPLTDLPPGAAEPALVLAMLRQESGFDPAAVSRAGALGLMQLMPATARNVARRLEMPYDKQRLTNDHAYNLALGRGYIAELLDTYDGSYPLALAAYNAGEPRLRRWLGDYGDPRTGHVDMIDWIELIPIYETRNYVQRVLEAVAVYRRLLGDPAPADGLVRDLLRGVSVPPG